MNDYCKLANKWMQKNPNQFIADSVACYGEFAYRYLLRPKTNQPPEPKNNNLLGYFDFNGIREETYSIRNYEQGRADFPVFPLLHIDLNPDNINSYFSFISFGNSEFNQLVHDNYGYLGRTLPTCFNLLFDMTRNVTLNYDWDCLSYDYTDQWLYDVSMLSETIYKGMRRTDYRNRFLITWGNISDQTYPSDFNFFNTSMEVPSENLNETTIDTITNKDFYKTMMLDIPTNKDGYLGKYYCLGLFHKPEATDINLCWFTYDSSETDKTKCVTVNSWMSFSFYNTIRHIDLLAGTQNYFNLEPGYFYNDETKSDIKHFEPNTLMYNDIYDWFNETKDQTVIDRLSFLTDEYVAFVL